eukprot:s5857_g3.t1
MRSRTRHPYKLLGTAAIYSHIPIHAVEYRSQCALSAKWAKKPANANRRTRLFVGVSKTLPMDYSCYRQLLHLLPGRPYLLLQQHRGVSAETEGHRKLL